MIGLGTLNILRKLPWKWIAVLAAGAAAAWYVMSLHLTISEQETTIARKDQAISSLQAGIQNLNGEVEQWKAEAQSRQQSVTRALEDLKVKDERSEQKIVYIESNEADSCREAIHLIDEALEL